ncbi:MAG TPA: peptidylprolyl isomerase, partial [Gammaproteobacteria bacterium]|nr:peptidylprolyl isomerase [Gammaproteobacteria bacterium]
MLASTISKLLIGLVLISGVLLAYTQLATAISIRDLLGLDKPESGPVQTAARDEPDRKGEQEDGVAIKPSLGYEEIVKIIAVATPEQRKAVLADKETFSRFIESEAGKKSVLAAASANKIDQDEQNLFLAKRGAENVLREIYVGKLISNKIPDDFPTDEQIRTYYEKNRDKFVLGKRVYIWQIFLPYTEGMSEKDREMLKKKAAGIKKDIEDKKLDFATAAQQYSGHQASRYKGGYM